MTKITRKYDRKKIPNRIHKGNLSNYNEINAMINELLGYVTPNVDNASIIKGDKLNRWETTEFIPNTF